MDTQAPPDPDTVPEQFAVPANYAGSGQADYFDFDETDTVTLPDGVSFIEYRKLNEGQRRKFQNRSNRDVKLHKGGEASIRMAPGDERHTLLTAAICGWNLVRGAQPVAFTERNLNAFLDTAPPQIIDTIEKAVRLANPWLLAEMSVEDIDREIETLQELRAKVIEEAEGKGISAR